jgi:hypothetical protein
VEAAEADRCVEGDHMNIGEPVRTLVVEPIVSPVPDGDLPGRLAELPPSPTTPTSGTVAATPACDPGA